MNPVPRRLWAFLAVGAATAVGVTTHDAGFTVITFFGSLIVPRILGLRGGHAHGACGHRHDHRARLEERLGEWHRQAHGEPASAPPPPAAAG
jgi:hypothetical protein